MKKYLLVLLCAISSLTALAQSGRFVNGVVFDENDSPMAGVKVVAKGGAEQFVTGSDGQFNMLLNKMINDAKAKITEAEKNRTDAIVAFNHQFGTYRANYTGERAKRESERINKIVNDIFSWPFTF